VDSAVSAALLKQQGFDVTGVFIKAWSPAGYPCTWKEDRRSAMRVCAVLDIPFLTLDLEKEYKKDVVDYMIREYKMGRTPNPDVMCNKEIKFGYFLKFALSQGADFVATGHYARIARELSISNFQFPKNENLDIENSMKIENCKLKISTDLEKDQSYFLWTLTQNELRHILFPIGHLQKSEVRKLALKFGLPQATRKDSQGLCFLGQIDMKEFLKEFVGTTKGDVLDIQGHKIGEHDGAILYTLGERHGFSVLNKATESEPSYVVDKNIEMNTVTVATKNQTSLDQAKSSYELEQTNWILGDIPQGKIECRYRYRQTKIPCRVEETRVIFDSPELIASGQSIVFYSPADEVGTDEICLGGAIIS
jgi:tRNA-specific 2-thiouridylase